MLYFCSRNRVSMIDIKYIVENADSIWENSRWRDGIKCPFCGCVHYYKTANSKFKCKGCKKIYTSTTNTLLHSTHLAKWKWLVAIYLMATVKNPSIREIANNINVNKNTAYLLMQKVRMSMSQDEIKLTGETIIDECYIGGWSNKHLSLKWKYMRERGYVAPDSRKYTKTQILRASSDYKQHVISMVDEEGKTKILHLPNPITKECVRYILNREDGITGLVCDESKLYENCGLPISTNNHSKHQWLTATGKSSNAVENRFSWTKRKININTHTSDKYLQLYLNYFAWQFNNKYRNREDKFYSILNIIQNKRITNKELFNYNYKKEFPKSRREKEYEEMKYLQSILGDIGVVLR